MTKYPIKKEFFPFSHFTPPISEKFLAMAVPHMKVPKFIYKDKELDVSHHEVESYDGEKIDEAYELFEEKRDGVIKVAVEC